MSKYDSLESYVNASAEERLGALASEMAPLLATITGYGILINERIKNRELEPVGNLKIGVRKSYKRGRI
jgi:hypothetical protein